MKRQTRSRSSNTSKSFSLAELFSRLKPFLLREKVIVVIVTLIVWTILAYVSFFYTVSQNGDSTFVAQVLYNFRTSWRMETSYYTSVSESIDHIWYKKAAEVCSMDLESKFKNNTPWGHNYFIAYLLIPLARMIDVEVVLAILHSGIYTSVLLFAYLLARKKKVSILLSILFVVAVSQHPLWRWGHDGQFYFNRFFLPFSAAVILILEAKKVRYAVLFILCVLAFSSNEINGIYIFIMFLMYMWIYRTFNMRIFLLALFFFGSSIVSTSYIQAHFPLVSTQQGVFSSTFGNGFPFMFQLIKSNIVNPKTFIFYFVNFFSLGMFTVFDVSLIVPFIFMTLPNLILSVGGGEKIGWNTHYHTGYFIPLIWISLLGISKINNRPKLQMAFMVLSIVVMGYLEPYTLSLNEKPILGIKTIANHAIFYLGHGQFELEFRKRLREAVGEGATISAPESITYHLYDHVMYYYPMGIDSVDVVILRFDATKTGDRRFSSINYGHQDPGLDHCIFDRMKQGGFDFSNVTVVDNWAILKRKEN